MKQYPFYRKLSQRGNFTLDLPFWGTYSVCTVELFPYEVSVPLKFYCIYTRMLIGLSVSLICVLQSIYSLGIWIVKNLQIDMGIFSPLSPICVFKFLLFILFCVF